MYSVTEFWVGFAIKFMRKLISMCLSAGEAFHKQEQDRSFPWKEVKEWYASWYWEDSHGKIVCSLLTLNLTE